jgi:predicted dehydrogenase
VASTPSEHGAKVMDSPDCGLNVVIAGTGRFGTLHGRVWQEAGAHVVGLCDVDGQRLEEASKLLGVTSLSRELSMLLETTAADVVVVASDEGSHVSLALEALSHGCHVFVEKPMALSGDDAWRIREGARAANRHVVAGQISRFAAPYARMKATLDSGGVGRLCALRLRRDFSREWFLSFGDRVHPVWESCIHDIDLAISFVGRPVTRVTAVQSAAAGNAAPSVVSALLEFGNGVIATIESAWLVPQGAPQTLAGALALEGSIIAEAEILGLDGVLRQSLVSGGLVEWTGSGASLPDLSLWPEEDGRIGGALRQEVEYARGVFTGVREPDRVPLEEVCWGVSAAEAIIRSLETRQPVQVNAGGRGA